MWSSEVGDYQVGFCMQWKYAYIMKENLRYFSDRKLKEFFANRPSVKEILKTYFCWSGYLETWCA